MSVNNEHKKNIDNFIENFDFNSQMNESEEPFTIQELKKVINTLKIHTASGEDNIHNQLIKNIPDNFLEIVLKLINFSFNMSVLPSSWKSSLVTMIPKKIANSPNPKDYRPISLTSNLCKLTERLILSRLQKQLIEKKVIIKQQSGFRAFFKPPSATRPKTTLSNFLPLT